MGDKYDYAAKQRQREAERVIVQLLRRARDAGMDGLSCKEIIDESKRRDMLYTEQVRGRLHSLKRRGDVERLGPLSDRQPRWRLTPQGFRRSSVIISEQMQREREARSVRLG